MLVLFRSDKNSGCFGDLYSEKQLKDIKIILILLYFRKLFPTKVFFCI